MTLARGRRRLVTACSRPAPGRRRRADRRRRRLVPSDLMYAISWSSCFLAHLALVGRHDRLKPGGDLARRVEDRLAQVRFVGERPSRRPASVTVLPNSPSSTGPRPCASPAVAGVAGEIRGTACRPPTASDPSAWPLPATPGYSLGSMHDDLADHPRVLACRSTRRRTGGSCPACVASNQSVGVAARARRPASRGRPGRRGRG